MFHSLNHLSTNQSIDDDLDNELSSKPSKTILVLNKVDLLSSGNPIKDGFQDIRTSFAAKNYLQEHLISCESGAGLDSLETALSDSIKEVLQSNENSDFQDEGIMITRERHRRHVRKCVEHLELFLSGMLPMDLAAEEIRLAMNELGKVTGRVDVEELLDIIFRDFCIGK